MVEVVIMAVKPLHMAQIIHIFMAYVVSNFFNLITTFLSINLIQSKLFLFLIYFMRNVEIRK
jgi:hypothetical protein